MTLPLSISDVSVNLDGRPVLHDTDLDVAAGEFVALLGTNGSGKSTLVRATVGLIPTAGGTIELFGTPLARFRDWHRLGYVPQRSSATSGVPATIEEVVSSGRLAHRRLFSRRGRNDSDAIVEAVARVGLQDRMHSSVNELSGGQQQRVLIARALAARSDILIMDEPTAGVDHDNQDSLAELLGGLVAGGTSVLLVAHELGPLEPLIDRAVVLRSGTVAYSGPVDGITDTDPSHLHAHTSEPTAQGSLAGEGMWR